MLRLLVVIVNYQTAELVERCVESLAGDLFGIDRTKVVIVDNDSADDSMKRLHGLIDRLKLHGYCELSKAPSNDGFAAGNNIGIQTEPAEFVLLLNSDTIVHRGALVALLECAERERSAGLIGARLEWPDGRVQPSAFQDPTPLSEFVRTAQTGIVSRLLRRHCSVGRLPTGTEFDTDWVSFACVLIRRRVLEDIGLLDEGFFMYFEDIDYCRRARAAGWNVRYCPEARIIHLRGGSSPVKELSAARKRRPRYYYESRNRYLLIHFGWWRTLAANGLWYAGAAVSLVRRVIQGRPMPICAGEWMDIWITGSPESSHD